MRVIHTEFINDLQSAIYDNVDESNKLGVHLINSDSKVESLEKDMIRLQITMDQLDEVKLIYIMT